ncbi:MAG: SH3 domain-containing protein [Oligoflexales bacterium]
MHLSFNYFKFFILIFLCLYFISNCSSSQQEGEQLETSEYQEEGNQYSEEGDEGGYEGENGNETYGEENGEGELENDEYGDESSGNNDTSNSYNLNNSGNEGYGFDNNQTGLGDGQNGDNLNYPEDQTQGGYDIGAPENDIDSSGSGGERVVRYVLENEISVYSEADINSEVVASLYKGQPLTVLDMGEWSQIGSNRYVMSASLSEQIVPRHMQPADWMAP